jgi:hypothetical protein
MLNVFRRHCIHRALLPAVLTSFTLTYAVPLPAQQFQFQAGLNEIAFMVRLEKLVEKLVKSEGKGIDKMVEYLVDIKNEVEASCNVKINVDKFMDDVSSELKKKGHKAPKKEFDAIKKKIKHKDKKHKGHALYLANTMYMDGYEMNEHDEVMMVGDFMAKSAKKDKDKDKDKDDKEEIVLPSLLVYGVTISLCGLFLMCIPIPACKDWGSKMVVAGVTACANSLCSENDKNKDKDKK